MQNQLKANRVVNVAIKLQSFRRIQMQEFTNKYNVFDWRKLFDNSFGSSTVFLHKYTYTNHLLFSLFCRRGQTVRCNGVNRRSSSRRTFQFLEGKGNKIFWRENMAYFYTGMLIRALMFYFLSLFSFSWIDHYRQRAVSAVARSFVSFVYSFGRLFVSFVSFVCSSAHLLGARSLSRFGRSVGPFVRPSFLLSYILCYTLFVLKYFHDAIFDCFSLQIVLGLRYIHKEKHIVHRDLTPNNIMLGENDKVTISKLIVVVVGWIFSVESCKSCCSWSRGHSFCFDFFFYSWFRLGKAEKPRCK